MNNLATLQYNELYVPNPGSHFKVAKVSFYLKGQHKQDIRKIIESNQGKKDILEHYCDQGWTQENLEKADWNAIDTHKKKLTPNNKK